MKTRWIVIGVLSFIAIVLLGSGAAPLMFSQAVYGCDLQKIMGSGDIKVVTENKITQEYLDKYEKNSSNTDRSRFLEWGYGIVEYSSSHYVSYDEERSSAHLKVIIDHCGIPQEFEFQCRDQQGQEIVSLNSKNDDLLKYLQTDNCLQP